MTESDKKIPQKIQNYHCENCNYITQSIRGYNKHLLTAKHKIRINNDSAHPKNPSKLSCENCNYNTLSLKDYNKHILTAKHIRMTNLQKIPEFFVCDCGKEYKFRQGLFTHKQKCTYDLRKKNDTTSNIESGLTTEIIMDIIKDNKELRTLLVEQSKQSEKQFFELQKENNNLLNKMAEITQTQLTIPSTITNNNNNNNTTNNNNNQFNLNFFLNETCKDAMNIQEFVDNIKITFEELLTIGNSGFVNGVSDIFIKQLRDLEVTKRPIHCTDVKRETIYFKDEDIWNKDKKNAKLKNIIEKVEYKNVAALHQWCNENPDSKINNSDYNLLRDKIYLQTLQGDEATREKILKNISKEIVIDKT